MLTLVVGIEGTVWGQGRERVGGRGGNGLRGRGGNGLGGGGWGMEDGGNGLGDGGWGWGFSHNPPMISPESKHVHFCPSASAFRW